MIYHFVTATRDSMEQFKQHSLLVKSLIKVQSMCQVRLHVTAQNRDSLALAYNAAIDQVAPEDILIFVHDDVSIDDWFFCQRLTDALQRFDIIAVAGNTRRQPRQESWIINPDDRKHDMQFISGAIFHGKQTVHYFGPCPAAIKLLDGVFIACRAKTLQSSGVRFDPQFRFHFYDTDFSRSCEQAGLSMGTWPIALTHLSAGKWQTPEWDEAFQAYLAKWRE